MSYKTELRLHTALVSPCATMMPEEIVEHYIKAGYTSVVVSDHFCDIVVDFAGITWQQKIDHYLSGYRRMKAYAKDRLNVLLGCEFRLTCAINDYLIFGMTEEFLYTHPNIHQLPRLDHFRAYTVENNMLIVQAHPFRPTMEIVPPSFLDGVEVFNATPKHAGYNGIADVWAKKHGLIRTSGSDFHSKDHPIAGGIITDEPITSTKQLVEVLRSGDYTLICEGPAAEKVGLSSMPARYDQN